MTDQTTEARTLSWRDGRTGPVAGLMYLSYAVALIGAAAFALSFIGVNQAARPYFGAVAWIIPLLGDLAIGVFTAFSIAAELAGLSSPTARWSSRLLIGFTIFANVAHEPGIYGRVLHAAPPVIWVLIVTTFEHLVRRKVGLNSPTRIEGLRKSLWLLRPIGTWRIWRRMRVEAIPTYREALDRDAARAAIVGRFRVNHGRMWRQKAPLSELIALRLQGRDPAGVAAILGDHLETAALLAGTVTEPVPETQPQPVESAVQERAEDTEATAPKPRRTAVQKRTRKGAKTPAPKRTDDELFADASALNAQVLAATGAPVSLRRLKADLRVGQPTAERLRDRLAAAPAFSDVNANIPEQAAVSEPVPVAVVNGAPHPIEYANGSAA